MSVLWMVLGVVGVMMGEGVGGKGRGWVGRGVMGGMIVGSLGVLLVVG